MSFFKKITESVSKGVSTATEKAQQTVEITRLNSQIAGKRKEIEKLFADIGESVYEAYRAHDLSLAEAKAIPACEEIVAIHSEIAALDDRIKEIRNEKDCVCGQRVAYDVRFCPSCGHPFPEPAQAFNEERDEPDSGEVIETEPAIAMEQEEVYVPKAELPPRSVRPQLCHNCGTRLDPDSRYCQTCGQAAYQ